MDTTVQNTGSVAIANPEGWKRYILFGLLLSCWLAAIAGSLQMHKLSGWMTHSICGPWGCAAAPESLIGYHLFIGLLAIPMAVLLSFVLPKPWRKLLGWLLLGTGLFGIATLAGYGAIDWLDLATPTQRQYTVQRAGFVMITTPDYPVMQTALAGLAVLLSCRIYTMKSSPAGEFKIEPRQ